MINSSFLFNAQIEIPPPDFIKLADKLNKNFLWGGTPKIAHHSIIADYIEGGIRYKDLDCFVRAINVKFLLNLTSETQNRCTILPQMWFNNLFKIPTHCINEDQDYFCNLFRNKINILDCKIKVPRKISWKGHPFYFEILKAFEKIISSLPNSLESLLSIPIWFNKYLQTKFDVDISRAGFNYLKDFYPGGHQIDFNLNRPGLVPNKMRKLRKILGKIPQDWRNRIESSPVTSTVVTPRQAVNLNDQDWFVQHLGSDRIYKILTSSLIKPPTGVLRWRAELILLSEQQLKTALTFAKMCSSSIFDQVFQYKIVTQILPTNKYLNRYKIKDSDLCSRCFERTDTVYHNLWQCSRLTSYLSACFDFLRSECNLEDVINHENYLFGFTGVSREGINHILLEFKKHVFYNWNVEIGVNAFCEQFQSKLRSLIIKEKIIAQANNELSRFYEKWGKYIAIYDFRGPDMQIIYS